MLVRVILALTCAAVAVALAQRKGKRLQDPASPEPVEEEKPEDGKEIYTYADIHATAKEEEEEILCGSTFSPCLGSESLHEESEELLLPEFDDLLCGESCCEFFNTPTAHSPRLKAVVSELQQKEMKPQAELLEYYGLKEQEENHGDLEKQLWRKNAEIERLSAKLLSLEEQAQKLSQDVNGKENLRKEVALAKIRDLQKTIHADAGQTKAQLLMLKQQVAILQEREEEASKMDFELEKKLQTLREMEVESMELRRTIKELQHQKRELTVKLYAAEAKIKELSSRTESDIVAEVQAQALKLRLANEDLSKQLEGLQNDRFSEVEELVYLRWVNACLRYELRNYKAPAGKASALDLGKILSPKSWENAKQLMLEYANPDLLAAKSREQSEQDYDGISSLPSTPSEGDFDDSSIDGGHVAHNSSSKKPGFIRKLKNWGRSKEDSPSSVDSRSSKARMLSPRNRNSKGSLASLLIRNHSDSIAITTLGTNELEPGSYSALDSNKSLGQPGHSRARLNSDATDVSNTIASSFELKSKSVVGSLAGKYPTFKDRDKLATGREEAMEEKAEQARVEKLVGKFKPATASSTRKVDVATPGKLNPNLFSQIGGHLMSTTIQNSARVVVNKMKLSEVEKAPRIPSPVPKSSARGSSVESDLCGRSSAGAQASLPPPPPRPPPPPKALGGRSSAGAQASLPPPPPPPPKALGGLVPPPPPPSPTSVTTPGVRERVQRAPEVVEFYQSLMRREAKKDSSMGVSDTNASDACNSMIGELENRSAFLLAVKADVETQADFVQSLATEVRSATYTDIEDVVAFVVWLDEELSFLVDERAVLKHFDWPESKADALREAAFEYQDLKKLEVEISSFEDDPHLSCVDSLKKLLSLLEKVEQTVYALLRTRDTAIARYKVFGIPTNWILDAGLIAKVKVATIQLARKYMRRVVAELDQETAEESSVKEPQREYLLLQGVRFAFRVHQFAGGFDAESMRTFEELRDRIRLQVKGHSFHDPPCEAN